jgi:hypothetical protein
VILSAARLPRSCRRRAATSTATSLISGQSSSRFALTSRCSAEILR